MRSIRTLPTVRLSRWLSISAAISIVLALLNGCGGPKATDTNMQQLKPTASFAFVSNSGAGTVSVFAVDTAGGLFAVAGSPVPSGGGAEFMAFDSVHKLLLVSNQTANSISVLSVNTSTGALTAVPGSPFATGARPTGVAVDSMGKFVFAGNQNSNSVSVFMINAADGALAPVPGSPFTGIASPFGVTVSPSGAFLFVNNFTDGNGTGANTVSSFSIGANGALTQVGSTHATSSPAGITAPIGIATDGTFLFVANHMAESVVPFNINATSGALTPVSTLPAPVSACAVSCHNNPLRLMVDRQDRFLFWTNVQAGTVVSFSINNGALALVSQAATGQHPFGLALDPGGNFLFVANKVDNTISAYSVNSSDGTISTLNGSPFSGGGLNAPTDVVIVAKQ
ncbi:MAG TPA: beta-propeller fold lactonase family protein [Candidatus Saccharimonadales bacterium]|jgi:6-phosphogluconolactonase (cycloisomerase 2 family)|nr:beta-propeller fold lactonase family protein [Candidatus Saccharimonadales bacterium]